VVRIGARTLVIGALICVGVLLVGCTSATPGPMPVPAGSATTEAAPATASSPAPPPTGSRPAPPSTALPPSEQVVPLAAGTSDEASGIAASTKTRGDYFLVDDGTGTDNIVAVGSDGAVIGRVTIDGMAADNAEALAAGSCGTSPAPGDPTARTCLYIGDIGDNKARRHDIAIFRIAEPDVDSAAPVPADEWRYTYPQGAQNAESLMVEPDGSLIIVTKPDPGSGLPHRMYRGEPGGGELSLVREFRPPAAQIPLRTLFTGNVVTDLAVAPGRVLLLTYDELQEYSAPDPGADLTGFPDWPHHRLPMPALPQAEGVTPAVDGCGYVVASEAGPGGSHGWLGLVGC